MDFSGLEVETIFICCIISTLIVTMGQCMSFPFRDGLVHDITESTLQTAETDAEATKCGWKRSVSLLCNDERQNIIKNSAWQISQSKENSSTDLAFNTKTHKNPEF